MVSDCRIFGKEVRGGMSRQVGYVRVSSRDQNEDRQMAAMQEMQIPEANIYVDFQSGKDFNRPMYRKMLRALRADDVVYIKSIDRLGRNYEEIQEQWRILTKEKHVDIVVIDMPLLDTLRGKDLVGTFLSDIVLQILSFVAENERTNIRTRQAEGIAAARKRGVRFGRPPVELPEGFYTELEKYERGEQSMKEAAAHCGMALSTFYYKAKKEEPGRR